MPNYKVELVFDDAGELTDVNPVDVGQKEKTKNIEISSLTEKRLKRLIPHTFFYGNGSPGCATYRTSDGYVTICWP
ncbi:MAG: hypothetical protein R6T90_05685 [Dissulfuribacterales bacterium]